MGGPLQLEWVGLFDWNGWASSIGIRSWDYPPVSGAPSYCDDIHDKAVDFYSQSLSQLATFSQAEDPGEEMKDAAADLGQDGDFDHGAIKGWYFDLQITRTISDIAWHEAGHWYCLHAPDSDCEEYGEVEITEMVEECYLAPQPQQDRPGQRPTQPLEGEGVMKRLARGMLTGLATFLSAMVPAEASAQEHMDVEVRQLVELAVEASIDERNLQLKDFSGRISIVNGGLTDLVGGLTLSGRASQRTLAATGEKLGARVVEPPEGKGACIDSADRSCFVSDTDLLFWPKVAEYDGKTALVGVHFQVIGPGDLGLRSGSFLVEMQKAEDGWRVIRLNFVTG